MNDQEVTFNVFNTMKYPNEVIDSIMNVIDKVVAKKKKHYKYEYLLDVCLVQLVF